MVLVYCKFFFLFFFFPLIFFPVQTELFVVARELEKEKSCIRFLPSMRANCKDPLDQYWE